MAGEFRVAGELRRWYARAHGEAGYFRTKPELIMWARRKRNYGDVTVYRWRAGAWREHSVLDWWCIHCHRPLDQGMGDHATCPDCGDEWPINGG